MKRKTLLISAAAALGLIVAVGATSYAHGPQGYGGMGFGGGYGMMKHGGGMGHMGGAGFGRAGCAQSASVERNLTVEQVTDIVKGRLASSGNPNLKVGTVQEIEDGTIKVDIVTVEDSLVRSILFDKKTGRMSRTY